MQPTSAAAQDIPTAPEASANVTADGVVPSQWILDLPGWLRAAVIVLYVDLLRPNDTFITQLRKVLLSVGMLLSFFGVVLLVYNSLTLDASVAAGLTGRIVPAFIPLLFVVLYFVARIKPDVPTEILAGLYVYGLVLVVFFASLAYPDWPVTEAATVVAILAMLLRVPGLPAALLLLTAVYVISAVNQCAPARGEPDVTMWTLPGAVIRNFQTRMLLQLASFGTIVLTLAALQMQFWESDKLTKQAAASSDLALVVAEQLGQYDTAGAKRSITEAADEGDAGTDLIASLRVLVDHLDQYRPHLPNWLVPRVESGDDDVMMRSRRPDDARTDGSLSSRRPRSKNGKSVSESGETQQTTEDTKSAGSGGPRDHTVASPHGGARDAAAAWFRGGAPFASQVTMAFLHFARGSPTVETSGATVRAARLHVPKSATSPDDALSAFVDAIHRLANQSSAAVHGFVGDTVVLSWNAASRAVQSEAKAARMVARLRNHLASHNTAMRVGGHIVSGTATIQLAGGASQQQAITISAPEWLPERQAAMAALVRSAAPTRQVVLLDAATKLGSEFAVVTRPFAVVTHDAPHCDVGNTSATRTAVYELLAECADGGNEEWMYLLAKQEEEAPNAAAAAAAVTRDTVARLFDLWQRGDDNALAHELRAIRSPDTLLPVDTEAAVNRLAATLRQEPAPL